MNAEELKEIRERWEYGLKELIKPVHALYDDDVTKLLKEIDFLKRISDSQALMIDELGGELDSIYSLRRTQLLELMTTCSGVNPTLKEMLYEKTKGNS